MAQLVGCPCAKCQKMISSIVDGEFCQTCGNAVHKACKVPSPNKQNECPSCGCDMDNPLAATVRAEAAREAHESRTYSSQPLVPKTALPFRVNKLGVRLLIGGSGCVILGLAGLVDGIAGGSVDAVIGGLLWKCPLLMAAGAGAVYYGYRILTDITNPS